MKTELEYKIIEYWHLSKGACQYPDNGYWHRSKYVMKWIKELHLDLVGDMTPKRLWLLIEDVTTVM